MSETISNTTYVGITLTVPVVITSTGAVITTGDSAAIVDGGAPGTLTNDGTVASGGLSGISLDQGGVINNQAAGLITGLEGIDVQVGGDVNNAGTIAGGLLGIYLQAGIVQNAAGGEISGGVAAMSGAIVNYGEIASGYEAAISFRAGGSVFNLGTKSSITGPNAAGLDISGGAGTVVNQGVINSVALAGGGEINNAGYIGAATNNYGITGGGALTSVQNTGYIAGASFGAAVDLTNAAHAVVSGYNDGILLGFGGYISNSGNIFGLGGQAGIALGTLSSRPPGVAGVQVTNGGVVENVSAAAIIAGRQDGVAVSGSLATYLVNQGTIIGDIGIDNAGSGNLTVYDSGTITGQDGAAIYFGAGLGRLIIEAGARIDGTVIGGNPDDSVTFASGAALENFAGLSTQFSGISNFSIEGSNIAFSGPAVLAPGATLTNAGTLRAAASFRSLGTIINTGTVTGALMLGGVYSDAFPVADPIVLSNGAGGLMSNAAAIGIDEVIGGAAVTIVNAGTIADTAANAVAISLTANQANLLMLTPGSTIIGAAEGGSAAGASFGSVLELAAGAGIGTIAGIGTSYSSFAAVELGPDAIWSVSASSGQIQVSEGADLLLAGPAAAGETVNLIGAGAVLTLEDPGKFAGTIVNFNAAQTVDLPNVAFHGASTATLAGNVLDVVANGATYRLQLDMSAEHGDSFHLSNNGSGGTDITEASVPCFLKNTLIRTPAGDVPVDSLAIGDAVMGADGDPLAVKWIGRRKYSGEQAQNAEIRPIRIKTSAFADGMPDRDLFISPSHALLIEGFHVPAGGLVNGVSIAPADAEDIEYFHVETERHSSIIANNTPAETFIDDDSRRLFDNADEFFRLYPGQVSKQVLFGVPRLECGARLEALRRKFALRAGVVAGSIDAAGIIGFLEHADRHKISGWAYHPATPNTPLVVEILNRGAVLARILANAPRPDVRLAGFGQGRCGFSVELPAPLPAFQRHEISVRPAGTARPLPGSPVVIDPGFVEDLVKTGGLRRMVDAALKSISGAQDISALEADLELSTSLVRSLRGAAKPTPARGGSRRTILFIDQHWPTPTRDAGSNAIISHAQAFQALGYNVAFCAASGAPKNILETAGLLHLRDQDIACHGQDGASAEEVIKTHASGLAFAYLHRIAIATGYAGLVRHHAPSCRIIYALADLHHLRFARQAAITGRHDLHERAKRTKADEFWAMRMADHVLTHSAHEAAYLKQAEPDMSVHVVPWSVEIRHPIASRMDRPDIAFIGGADHAPNVDAVLHLAQNILPAVWQKIPALRCLVIGEGWPKNIFGGLDARLTPIGHHADLATALAAARLTVAPLRFGAGIKGKVLESFGAGVPCVMSPIAAEGLDLDMHLQAAVSDLPDFAATLTNIYKSRKRQSRLARSGQALLASQFSASAVAAALSAMLGERRSQTALTKVLRNTVSLEQSVIV